MRLDKFLKDSRLIKRRSVAKEMCDAGKVALNGNVAKASNSVNVGDEITIEFVKIFLTVRVETLQISLSKALAPESYTEVKQVVKENIND